VDGVRTGEDFYFGAAEHIFAFGGEMMMTVVVVVVGVRQVVKTSL
jgi:hypothetical protein